MLGRAGDGEERHRRSPPRSSRARRRTSSSSQGSYRIKGTDRTISHRGAGAASSRASSTSPTQQPKFGATFPNGCHIAEVEIDPETGEREIVSYVACDDAGNIINHQIVEGPGAGRRSRRARARCSASRRCTTRDRPAAHRQLHGLRHAARRAGGRPAADRAPGADRSSTRSARRAWARRGVTGSMPALMNAVLDALRHAGVKQFEMPATPSRVWQALRSGQ